MSERGDGILAFRRAERHSRHVRLLRKAIPIVIAVTLGSTMLIAWIDPLKVLARIPGDHGKLVIHGTKITMEAPKLSGYTKDRRWYEMSAQAAAQDVTKPDTIELVQVRAKIETNDKSTISLSAQDGLFDRKASVLTLEHSVLLKSSSGYEMHLEEAVVDTAKGQVVSNKPVAVFTDDATINSDRLEVEDSGQVVRFIGTVVMNLNNLGKQRAPETKP